MNATEVPPPPAVPDHDLLRCVGRGSYGAVWLAQSVTGRFRGIKIIQRQSFDHERPFEREFTGIQKYEPISRTHAGLVAVLHVGRGDGYFYYVMEVADDQQTGSQIHPSQYAPRTLSSELAQRGRLPPAECVQLSLRLTDALEHLHQEGLVHRDIKPSNIIFINGAPKFADIGLVTGIGAPATYVGTAGYIAPEGPGSAAADLFSLGKVLYEISMGKDREEFPELPTQLRELPDAPALVQLNSIILRACASDPKRRFASAAEMHQALAQLAPILNDPAALASAPSAADPSGTSGKPSVVFLNTGHDPRAVDLARALIDRLQVHGIESWLDDQPQPSVTWARDLEVRLENASVVVALLSAHSIPDEMLHYGLELVRPPTPNTSPRRPLVGVFMGARGAVPRLLELALQHATILDWTGPQDSDAVADTLRPMINY